ncbi:hypothetical protein GCM10019059_34720 [Camelimonas fluminis]|uniref:PadR family transcriptional regulator n=1 Tax=Camelimonas fluminis TaxID=1576911 RepID=A0ABV7UGE2_9HYPH|nr:hypothetical protein [Camelimonas fluminis]GHE72173.1 hypothetical protein GCM10019059_34720 [Camelimonas fluminis]
MARKVKPSPVQQAMLRNLIAGHDAFRGLPGGRSHFGGQGQSLLAMFRREWVTYSKGRREYEITDAGRAALSQEDRA